ncbi:hypothetical protein GCM10009830_18120 [Glycomyces endophyticus]|uniref:Uncharacterized protein n=1 Tax=Glycomyces endophyticus TaxID=480996 RepID=A0ABP4SME0_9ACTN
MGGRWAPGAVGLGRGHGAVRAGPNLTPAAGGRYRSGDWWRRAGRGGGTRGAGGGAGDPRIEIGIYACGRAVRRRAGCGRPERGGQWSDPSRRTENEAAALARRPDGNDRLPEREPDS